MTDNYISIYSYTIYEPTTVLTDCMIFGLSIFFFTNLSRLPKEDLIKNWKFFFLFFGLSTFIGAFSHAFYEVHEGLGYKSFWLTMQIFNGAAVLFAQLATFNKKLKPIFIIQLLIFVIAVFVFQKFLVVIINNAISLIPVMIFSFKNANKKIGYGILVSFATALIHGFKISIHTFFNYNDIAHILIMLSLYIMHLGIKEKASQ